MSLQPYVTKRILVLTSDGRILLGTLLSCDQLTNLVLGSTIERIVHGYDDEQQSQQIEHGLYLIRGDNVAVVGEVDVELDGSIDWTTVKGGPIGTCGRD
ncbi:MAG: hypothetical protein M1825_003047 [Sarcosagium campestre]|nr:MAG: hypothetical protein M1825_003047 [Sarcosagium campestre]